MRTVPNRPSKTGTMTTPSCVAPVKPTLTPERRPVGRGAAEDGQTHSHFKHESAYSNASRLTEKQKQSMLLPEQSEEVGQVQPKRILRKAWLLSTHSGCLSVKHSLCVSGLPATRTLGSHQTSGLSCQCAGNTGIPVTRQG